MDRIYLPAQLTDWLQVEVALLLGGLTESLFKKPGFDRLGRDQSSFRLSALSNTVLVTSREDPNTALLAGEEGVKTTENKIHWPRWNCPTN